MTLESYKANDLIFQSRHTGSEPQEEGKDRNRGSFRSHGGGPEENDASVYQQTGALGFPRGIQVWPGSHALGPNV